jgi:hypothetical protein
MYGNIAKTRTATSKKTCTVTSKIMYYIIKKLCVVTSKIMYYNIENYVLQHKKKYILQHRKNQPSNIENRTIIRKTSVTTTQKISLQHSKIICCNIKKTHCNTEKTTKGRTEQQRDGFDVQAALALAHHLRARRREEGRTPRARWNLSHHRVPHI